MSNFDFIEIRRENNTRLDVNEIDDNFKKIEEIGLTKNIINQPGGVAGLDDEGKIPAGQLPPQQEIPYATLTQRGIVQLEDSITSTSITMAAVPNSVKSAYDLANIAKTIAIASASKTLIREFTSSGTFTIADYGLKIGDVIDFYEVGGGAGGNNGHGGGGGYCRLIRNFVLTQETYSITVGVGGAPGVGGGSTVAFGTTVNGAAATPTNAGGSGGSGGGSKGSADVVGDRAGDGGFGGADGGNSSSTGGNGGGNIAYQPFNPYDNILYGCGGGGGHGGHVGSTQGRGGGVRHRGGGGAGGAYTIAGVSAAVGGGGGGGSGASGASNGYGGSGLVMIYA